MTGLFFYLRSTAPGVFKSAVEHPFPEPTLEKSPQDDLRRFERDQRAALSGYGWVDRSKGLVRIPIEEAMRIVAARGDHAYDPLDPPANSSDPVASSARTIGRSPAMKYATLLLALSLWPAAAWAALTEQQIREVALAPPPGARVPTALVFTDLQGSELTLGGAMAGRPTLLLPADFTCTEICGPALSITASALSQTGLEAGRDYSLVVVGIDANDGTADARRFAADQVGGPGVSVLTGDADAIRSLMTAIGYHFQRDAANDAIAHPAGFVTLTSDGRVSRVLSSLALQPIDLRLALVEAGEGRIGGLAGRLALLCYGFDAVHGIYSARIATALRIGGGLTVAALAAGLGLMLWRTRKRGASA